MGAIDYSNIENVEQLNEYLCSANIANITEKKCCGGCKKGEEEEESENGASKDDKQAAHDDALNKTENLTFDYAEKGFGCIFKHIIVFTNDDDPKGNKTLKNIYDAVKAIRKHGGEEPTVDVFVAADVTATDDESEITITDGEKSLTITEQSNVDTLVFSRLGVQGEDNCEHIVQLLQDRGFLVLNPIKYAALACDKYQTALLLKKGDVPQPNFCLMTKDILYDEKLYTEAMRQIYPDWDDKDNDKNEDKQFVCKILDGHGGTGVFLVDGKRIMAILQTLFAIDSERNLIIQRKEEADGGDIRVHVLTLRDKQVILAAMKRVKIKSDFRSNVSLGASAEKVTLTPEQEQIALRVAKLSNMPWCAVDIMPLVKGSNKELGDNVVLEMNASPGTDGITDVIGFNFINILLNALDDSTQFVLQDKIAGYQETVNVKWDGENETKLLAKLDTGNGAKASCVEVGEYTTKGNKITFSINDKEMTFDVVDKSRAVRGDDTQERPIIRVEELRLGLRKIRNVELAVVKQRNKSTNILLNRDILSKMGYVVSPSVTHKLTEEMEKIKII